MIITFFNSQWDTYTSSELSEDWSWDEVADLLTTFNLGIKKEDIEMYNLWSFKAEGGQIHRCKEDAEMLYGLVLDYDNNLTLEQAVEQFTGFECVIYTTFNHSAEKDKFRVVIPFTRGLTKADFFLKKKAIMEYFPGVDGASLNVSQVMFLHSGPAIENSIAMRLRGEMIDPSIFESEVITPYVPVVGERVGMDEAFKVGYKKAVIESLMSCKGFRHLTSMSVVVILKSCGAEFADYCRIVAAAGDSDSWIQDPEAQKQTWNAVKDEIRIGREKRDKFIAAHRGNPIRTNKIDVTKQRIAKLEKELYGTSN